MLSLFGILLTVGLVVFYLMLRWRLAQAKQTTIALATLNNVLFYAIISAIFGGHFGYMIIRYPELLSVRPSLFFFPWQGGVELSLALLFAALAVFAWQRNTIKSLLLLDFVVITMPVVIFSAQLGNYIEFAESSGFALSPLIANNGLFASEALSSNTHIAASNAIGISQIGSLVLALFIAQFFVFLTTYLLAKRQNKLGSATGVFLLTQALVQIALQLSFLKESYINAVVEKTTALVHISSEMWLSILMMVTGIVVLYWGYVNHANSLIAEKK